MASLIESIVKASLRRVTVALFSTTVTYRVALTGVETPVRMLFQELSGGIENFSDQAVLSRSATASVSAEAVAAPVAGDYVTHGTNVWQIARVDTNNGMHDLKLFLPEVVA